MPYVSDDHYLNDPRLCPDVPPQSVNFKKNNHT
jgi:hypothetical protein